MSPNERAKRAWVMSMAHTLYRRGERRQPFGQCLSRAWELAREARIVGDRKPRPFTREQLLARGYKEMQPASRGFILPVA